MKIFRTESEVGGNSHCLRNLSTNLGEVTSLDCWSHFVWPVGSGASFLLRLSDSAAFILLSLFSTLRRRWCSTAVMSFPNTTLPCDELLNADIGGNAGSLSVFAAVIVVIALLYSLGVRALERVRRGDLSISNFL